MRAPKTVAALAATALAVAGCGQTSTERLTATTPSYAVALTLDPPVVGETTALVEVAGRDGTPLDSGRRVTLVPVMTQHGHVADVVAVPPSGEPGRYRATGELFFMDGVWDVDVQVDGSTGGETARFRVLVSSN